MIREPDYWINGCSYNPNEEDCTWEVEHGYRKFYTQKQIVEEYKAVYPSDDIYLYFSVFAIIVEFYQRQVLPLNGKIHWIHRDYHKFIEEGDCRPYRLFKDSCKPKKEFTPKRVEESAPGPDEGWN